MRKAVTGGMLWTILIIIVGIAAIALLWLFMSGVGEELPDIFGKLVDNFKKSIKSLLGPWLGWILG